MKRLTIFMTGLLLILTAVLSCTENNGTAPDISTSTESIDFPKEGGEWTIAVDVTGSDTWKAYASCSWISLSPDYEKNTLTIYVPATEDIQDKSEEVIVYSDFEKSVSIKITQKGFGLLHERNSRDLMKIKGKVKGMDFYFDPAHIWEVNPMYFYNLEFSETGMLTHYEYWDRYMDGSMMNYYADVAYDDQNRLESIRVRTDAGDADNYPKEFTLSFEYGNHGKYISTRNLLSFADSWFCYVREQIWLPEMIRNLEKITLSSEFIERATDGECKSPVSLAISVDGNEGKATYHREKDYEWITYGFTGDYTTSMKYSITFVGWTIDSFVNYEIDPVTGNILRMRHYNDEVFGTFMEKCYNEDLYNTPATCEDNVWTYYRMAMEYNERYDLTTLTADNYGYRADFAYSYDAFGNWTGLQLGEGSQAPIVPLPETRSITYYND